MATIRDAIEEWERTNVLSSSAVTRDETVYNHIRQAVQALKEAPWAALVLQADMPQPAPPETPSEAP